MGSVVGLMVERYIYQVLLGGCVYECRGNLVACGLGVLGCIDEECRLECDIELVL